MSGLLSWRSRGLCRLFTDINFVPDPFLGEDSLPAKRVCEHCPVRDQCREYGDEHRQLGVWGGDDEVDRLVRIGEPSPTTCSCGSKGSMIPTPLGTVCVECGDVTS